MHNKKSTFFYYKGKKHYHYKKCIMFLEGKPLGIIINTLCVLVDKNLKLGDSK